MNHRPFAPLFTHPSLEGASYGSQSQERSNSIFLSEISTGVVDPLSSLPFKPSDALICDVRSNPREVDEIVRKISHEALQFANRRKEHVRSTLKSRQQQAESKLSVSDRSKLRSRREARVTRVKERAYEKALKDSIHWLVDEMSHMRDRNIMNVCSCQVDGPSNV